MLLHHKANVKQRILAQLYKIEADLLADDNHHAWTNLGLWQVSQQDYVSAAKQLTLKMGQALNLSVQDHLLDVGCGYGASLHLWHQQFGLDHITALELQPICCRFIERKKLAYVQHIVQQSIFDPKPKQLNTRYDVIVSVDATYHYALQDYLKVLEDWLKPDGRIGFHLLMRLNPTDAVSVDAQQALKHKLKWAKIDFDQVLHQDEIYSVLQQHGYDHIQIEDLSQGVLNGFYQFVMQKKWSLQQKINLGYAKIYATARLCKYLVESKQCAYIQVTAQKSNTPSKAYHSSV